MRDDRGSTVNAARRYLTIVDNFRGAQRHEAAGTDDCDNQAAFWRKAMGERHIYAKARTITDLADCDFNHTMEIPGYGLVSGSWDLRGRTREYLGGVELTGKRVLEMGTASGFLCFSMEQQGADVVAYDLSEHESWDVVPFSQTDYSRQHIFQRKAHIRRINNSFWLAHRACRSRSRVVYGTAYSVPEEIGLVDVTTFGAILLHVRDPFLALQSALRLTRETIIVTDVNPWPGLTGPVMHFLPDFRNVAPFETWWRLTPEVVQQFIGILGFEDSEVTHHSQKYMDREEPMFTVVGRRTRSIS